MTDTTNQARAYDQPVTELPSPARFLTLAELQADLARYTGEPEQGGVIVLVDDDQLPLGVLTREKEILAEAQIAAMVANGTIPPLEQLTAQGYQGDDPQQIADAIREGRALLGPDDGLRYVTLRGAKRGRYIVRAEHPDGSLTVEPDTNQQ